MVYTYEVQPHWQIKIDESILCPSNERKMDLLIPKVWRMDPHIAELLGKFTDALHIQLIRSTPTLGFFNTIIEMFIEEKYWKQPK